MAAAANRFPGATTPSPGAGSITAMTSSKPARWRTALRYWWVAIKLTITAALTAVVVLVLEPGLATTAAAESLSDAQRTRVALEPAIALALLIVNVVLGRSKPRRRLQRVIPDPVRHSVRNGAHHG
jgi:hypothetical protein